VSNVIATKTVNALIPEAEMGFAAKFVLDKTGDAATGAVLEVAKKMMGGLWVGGTVAVQRQELVFRPNWFNRLIHKADYTITIPLPEISQVDVRFGVLTKIVDINTGDGRLTFRCYGAEDFANLILSQLPVVRHSEPDRHVRRLRRNSKNLVKKIDRKVR
jgi:hypothetical protein